MTSFAITTSLEFIEEAMKKVGNFSSIEFTSCMCMLIEEYCYKYGLSAKEMMGVMARASKDVEAECGVYTGGLANG